LRWNHRNESREARHEKLEWHIFSTQRARESNPVQAVRVIAQFLRKLAAISALTAFVENECFARIAQNYAV
jgi:hypothetical protein